jgi:hypothetical protein
MKILTTGWLLLLTVSLLTGCAPTALGTGNSVPQINAAGWINGNAPGESELIGKVVVLEVFATW